MLVSDGARPEFRYSDLLPIGPDDTPYRLVTRDGVSTFEAGGRTFLQVSGAAIRQLTAEAMPGTNLPAQIELYSTPDHDGVPEYKFLFMAKGGGSANKSFLFQETKAVLNPTRMLAFLDEKVRSLGTAACPPYHLAVVIGG